MNTYHFTLSIVHYEGTLAETGEVFDTTHEDNSIFSFEIGQGAVIKAWDIALRTMKVCKRLRFSLWPFTISV
jgi:FKBP-type peptidyl-prolyl cis-trans isomerase